MRRRIAIGVLGIFGSLVLASAVQPASATSGVTPQGPAQAPAVVPALSPLVEMPAPAHRPRHGSDDLLCAPVVV
jgi:hypothetical protein